MGVGWRFWLVTFPQGWRGAGDGWQQPGGDELFVISGDLRTFIHGDPVDLREGDYVCDPDRFTDGGAQEESAGGCVVIRWMRGVSPYRRI